MPITTELIERRELRETFGHDSSAINKHSVRVYGFYAGGVHVCDVMLDRNLDGCPKFFTACRTTSVSGVNPPQPIIGILPEVKVAGCREFGDGMPWTRSLALLKESLDYKYRNSEL